MRFHFSFLFLILFVGCKGATGPAGPAGPQGTLLTGNLVGYVFLYDEGGQLLPDNSGVSVALEGLPISTTSDARGRWMLTGLTTGVYTIVFSKQGYGTYKIVSFQFVGGGEVYASEHPLVQLPSFTVPNISASVSVTDRLITVTGNVSTGMAPQRTVMLFFGASPLVSSEPANYVYAHAAQTSGDSTSFTAFVYSTYLNSHGIASGTRVYLRAYPSSSFLLGYIDPSTGRMVYCSLGPTPSNVDSVVVP